MHTTRVFAALLPLLVSFLRDHRRWIWYGGPVPRTAEFHQRRARRLVTTLAKLGPTFVKMAQVFAARADLIAEPYIGELGTLHDRVPPITFDAVRGVIAREYGHGATPDTLFEQFEREPIAAASLGQVHRARWHGHDVAVKVLRPGIEVLVAKDIRAARRLHRFIVPLWRNRHVAHFAVVIDEFEIRIAEEMDFRLEAEHATEIKANFADNREVLVPLVHHEMTRQRVLVLEYMPGTRIDKVDESKVDVRRVVATLVELYVQMMLIDGLFHADPHPGNLMLSPDGRLVLLDFGMVVRVDIEARRTLMRTVVAAIRRDPEGVADGFAGLGLAADGTERETLVWLARLLIANAYAKTTTQERIDSLLADRVMKTLFDFPVVLPQHLVYFARTAALIEGVGTRFDPYFQAIPIASPVVLRMRSRILRSLGEVPEPSASEVATVAGHTLGRLARWVVDQASSLAGAVSNGLSGNGGDPISG